MTETTSTVVPYSVVAKVTMLSTRARFIGVFASIPRAMLAAPFLLDFL
jgi:hypothetical protein